MYLVKNRKRILCVLLCVVTLTTSVFYVYKKPVEVKAVAVVDDVAVLLTILAATGCMYYGTQVKDADLTNMADWDWGALVDNTGWMGESDDRAKAEESMQRLYENAMIKEGFLDENGNWKGDGFDPNNDDPSEKPPKWEQLKDLIKKNGGKLKIGVGTALAGVMGKFGADIYHIQQQGNYSSVLQEVMAQPDFPIDNMLKHLSNYPYYSFMYRLKKDGSMDIYYLYLYDKYPYFYKDLGGSIYALNSGNMLSHSNKPIVDEEWLHYTFGNNNISGGYIFTTNLKIYDNQIDARNAMGNNEQVKDYPFIINPKTLPFSTDAMDFIKNNPDSPTVPVAPNVTAPTLDDMKDFLKNIKDNPTNPQPIVNNFIQNITTNNTDPDLTPEPTPTPDSKPTPNPTPDVDPTPTPDPSVTPKPDDGGGDGKEEPELKPEQLEFDIKLIFPFCIPFDFMDFITVLDAEPVTPKFECKMPVMSDKGIEMHDFTIDFAYFDSISELVRKLELLIFIIGLILATRHLIRG